MTIPTYEALMLPILRNLASSGEQKIADLRTALASQLHLTYEDLAAMLPSGKTPTFNSRVHWAKTYLQKAGVVESRARGTVRITDRGEMLFRENLEGITTRLLTERYEEMRAWRAASERIEDRKRAPSAQVAMESQTPQERFEESYAKLRADTEEELLARVKTMLPAAFERLVVDLIRRLGYGGAGDVASAIGRSGDGGIDGVVHEDALGLDVVYVQAKRWEGNVGGSVVRQFAGSLSARRARKGVIITTSAFTSDARDDASRMNERIVLVDGRSLARYMYDTGLGLTIDATFELKRLDIGYFE